MSKKIIFLNHLSPIENPPNTKRVSLSDINQSKFNFKDHFSQDKIIEINNDWWLVNKTLTWSSLDCMIAYTNHPIKSAFCDFTPDQLNHLFKSAYQVIQTLQTQPNIKKIITGATLIHQPTLSLSDHHFFRLHFHITGFTTNDFKKMKPISADQIKQKHSKLYSDLFSPLIPEFQKKVKNDLLTPNIPLNITIKNFPFGLKIIFKTGFETFNDCKFSQLIKTIDLSIKNFSPTILYSISLTETKNRLAILLTPESKGVLEPLGIILKRSSQKKFSPTQLQAKKQYIESLCRQLKTQQPSLIVGPYLSYLVKK